MEIDSFDGQRQDEEIKEVWRTHPFVMAKGALWVLLLVFIGSMPEAIWSPRWGIGFLIFFICVAGLYGLAEFYLWFATLYILTNQRIFAINQKRLFVRAHNEVPLENIQNASHTKRGISQTLLDYGEVQIETSGAKTALILKNVPHPYFVQQKILSK
jgi:uncharacterized membrane protein YdbT with pleckstrin-like domain